MSSLTYEIIYGNADILAVSKPAGISVDFHKGESTYLEAEVKKELPHFFLCHRIDKQTSGVVLLANGNRNEENTSPLSVIQSNWHQDTRKTYLAIIKSPSWKIKEVDQLLFNPQKGIRQTAITGFRVIVSRGGYALVECRLLQNGRMHQIRKHLNFIGHPIVGDRHYGGEYTVERKGQLLHAWKLHLKLANEARQINDYLFTAPIPNDFRAFLKSRGVKIDWEEII